MASTTIHTLSYKMVADTQQFTKGLVSTKSEIALMKKLMGDTSPEEKTAKALEMLNRLYDNGKISADKFKSATMQVEQELKQVQFAASNAGKAVAVMHSGFAKGATLLKSGTSQLAAIAGSYLSIQTITSNITEQINRIDKVADLAESLDASAEALLKMQYAFERGGGLGSQESIYAIKTFVTNVALANQGLGKTVKTLEAMGFEADTIAALNFADPIEKVKIIADELAKVSNPADRLAAIIKLFGTGGDKMTAFFAGGSNSIAEMVRKAERLQLAVNDLDAAKMGDLVQKTEDMIDAWRGLGTVLARDIMPVITASIRMLTKVIEAATFVYGSPDTRGVKDLTFGQRARLMLGFENVDPIQVFGKDIIFGDKPTPGQAAAFKRGQAQRGFDQLRNVTLDMPDFIGRRLDRLIEIGEQQIQNRDEDRKLD